MFEKPTIPEVVERFAAYSSIPGNGAWGSLHIVLDDGNVGNDSVKRCIEMAVDHGDAEGAALAAILFSMSKTQRLKLPSAVARFIRGREAANAVADVHAAAERAGK